MSTIGEARWKASVEASKPSRISSLWFWRIGELRGVPIYLHATMLVVVAAVFVGMPPIILCVYPSILLHELAHAVVAQQYGVRCTEIVIHPLGGGAKVPMMRFLLPDMRADISLAGPLMNAALAVCFLWSSNLTMTEIAEMNLWIALGNLIPVMPLDGGRLLDAVMCMVARSPQMANRALARIYAYQSVVYATLTFGTKWTWGPTLLMVGTVGAIGYYRESLEEARHAR